MTKIKRPRKKGNPCHTYWGSHGCKKQAGHKNRCVCDCNQGIPEGAVQDEPGGMYYVPDPTGNNYGLPTRGASDAVQEGS